MLKGLREELTQITSKKREALKEKSQLFVVKSTCRIEYLLSLPRSK